MDKRLQQLAEKHAREYAALMVEIVGESMSLGGKLAAVERAKRGNVGATDRIRSFVKRQPWSTTAEIAKGAGVARDYASYTMARLEKTGEIQKRGERGRFKYAAAVRAVKGAAA